MVAMALNTKNLMTMAIMPAYSFEIKIANHQITMP
jgi:hypothetical protein